ncbi:RNA 2'-phosphotransferase, partial [Roseovarius sp. MBR-6]|uniref:RNA 2'-phosphotransferase n=1 Tax=Roseovarius sp. MBR-6 TaxID=3156459 RepID=UPI003395EE50
ISAKQHNINQQSRSPPDQNHAACSKSFDDGQRTSKFLPCVLRHQPELLDLKMDSGGWVLVGDLLRGMKRAGHHLSVDELRNLVADNDKRRFTLSENGQRIRAAQGHSIAVELGLPATVLPLELFNGNASATLDAIWSEGIMPARPFRRARCQQSESRWFLPARRSGQCAGH